MNIKDTVAVVTGGGNGIGAALCERFSQIGLAGLAVLDLDGEAANRVADKCGGRGFEVDVTDESSLAQAIQQTEEQYGRVDIVVSNAGIGFADGSEGWATSCPNDRWQEIWEVNVMAHVYAARAALPGMIERGQGYFLHTVSAAGLLSQIGSASYATTKHAAIGFAESLAITHGDDGIVVSVLCPQGVDTKLLRDSERHGPGPQSLDGVLSTEVVADCVVRGMEKEEFLILPHPQALEYYRHKAQDYDRWLSGMRRLRTKFL
ncbi:MAG: SDR family NAD(P)-dependent oxidoreductase [Pseudomonadota bacterium]